MNLAKLVPISIASLFIYACSHPIEIVGEGDVTSASGDRNCTLADFQAGLEQCTKNVVVYAYQETYTPVAHSGWQFDHWENYCSSAVPPNYSCSFNYTAQQVKKVWFKTMPPLKAVFSEVGTPVYSWILNDTGITFGGNYPTGNNADCTGATIAQQDCSHGRDATHNDDSDGHAGFSYTKLASDGAALPASATSWACVRDDVTGLVWEGKTDDGGIHDKDNTYRWGGKTAQGTGYGTYYPDWDTLVDGSNNEALCGYTDWRVPTRFELAGLVNFNRFNPAIDTAYFPNTNASDVWSASPSAGFSYYAWVVGFYGGYSGVFSGLNFRASPYGVRLVRSGQ